MIALFAPGIMGLSKKAFGKDGDGTYILPPDLINNSKQTKLLSFGVNDDISFEIDFAKAFPLIDVFAFDPTVDSLPEVHPGIHFYKIGLSGSDAEEKQLYSFESIIRKLNLSQSNTYLLKIDIEGWEWDFLSHVDLDKYDVPLICMELHFLPLHKKRETLLLPFLFYKKYRILKKLFERYYVYHVHANNYQYFSFKRFRFPTYLEVTLIHKKCFTQEVADDVASLNKPTIPGKPDYQYPFIFN